MARAVHRARQQLRATALAVAFGTPFAGVARATEAQVAESDEAAGEAACISAYEGVQEQRLAGALIEARARARACAAMSCPAFIHGDCTTWQAELEAEVPSVAFDVESNGVPLSEVRVSEGDRVIAQRLEGRSFELDPGSHSLRFEAAGVRPHTMWLQIARGERNRRVRVTLAPIARPLPAKSEPESRPGRSMALPLALVGTGLAGLSAFTVFGSAGLSEEAKLEQSCAPRCSDESLQSVQTKYLVADVSLVVGVGALFAGGYLLLAGDPRPAATARSFPVRVEAGARGGLASVSGKF